MSWIKNFRLRYGLTQSQLARFVGLTRNYIAVLEGRTEIPTFLERLLFDLEAEFESASNSQEGFAPQSHPFQQQKRLSQLQRIIKKKKAQLLRLEKKFASLETRYANLDGFGIKVSFYTNSWYFCKKKNIMARNTSILLGDYFENFIQHQVQSGKFSSASEVIRAALRLFEESEKQKAWLIAALKEGEKSGFVEDFDKEDFLKKLHQKASTDK